jgi:cation diffusion facilitator CzcD-associated flavoprotein CzcO
MQTVAVIGAGPAGLAAARFLKSEGLAPTIFERGEAIGGQWSGDPACSAAWPELHTNTSRALTVFSDLPHAPDTPLYPSFRHMRDYLRRYAEMFDLMPCIRLRTRVLRIAREINGAGWTVACETHGDGVQVQRFDQVMVASGRCSQPWMPEVPGMMTFAGARAISHSFDYKGPERFRGQRVLVAGSSISAVEIASDLALGGAAGVVASVRRQRYIYPKIVAGMPSDQQLVTRYETYCQQSLAPELISGRFKDYVIGAGGLPERYGALPAADDIAAAGVTMSQAFLPLVAEGRIRVKPWIESIDGRFVRFADGSVDQFDAIVFCTGYQLHLPFFDADLQRVLGIDDHHIELYGHTFHPDLPGLAVLGMMDLRGTIFPVLELQARWAAYVASGARPLPPPDRMRGVLERIRALGYRPKTVAGNHAMLLFAREAGVDTPLDQRLELARALLFGPMSAISFRLCGRDSLPHAAQRVIDDARALGMAPCAGFTPAERERLRELADARRDERFSRFVDSVCGQVREADEHGAAA